MASGFRSVICCCRGWSRKGFDSPTWNPFLSSVTVKDEAIQMIQSLPEDVTLEEIQYRLYVRAQIQRGMADIRAGRTFTQEQVEAKVQEWLKSAGQTKL